VAKDTGYWGDNVRQIGYKKKKLGTGMPANRQLLAIEN
jgi:hypothetical protein